MKRLSPDCHNQMEESKLEWDMKPGDAIIWNRWTFHRGVAAVVDDEAVDFVKRRYSVRYIPYGSKGGPFVHPSVGPGNTFDSPYYPQVWPRLKDEEIKALEHGLEADFQLSKMIPFISKMLLKKLFPSITLVS